MLCGATTGDNKMRLHTLLCGILLSLGVAILANSRVVLAAELSTPLSAEAPFTDVVKIATGGGHTCAVTTAGSVKCWGWNQFGQLGNHSNRDKGTPIDVEALNSGVSDISAGFYFTCVLTTSGGVKCWGRNDSGQLGNNSSLPNSNVVDVVGLGSGIAAISAGSDHACALTTGGGVKCWGSNQYGQLGNNSTTNSSTPVDVSGLDSDITAIGAGSGYTCALNGAGMVKCWGRNEVGQLGNGNTSESHLPVDVTGLSNVLAIGTGAAHTCAKTNSDVKCWGWNLYGQLGNNSTTNSSTAVDVSGLGSDIKAIGAGAEHSCALNNSGALRCWGSNRYGQLGNNSEANSSIPVNIGALGNNVKAISLNYHNCAVMTTGTVNCWGWNSSGQLGNDTPGNSRKPVDVSGLTSGSKGISVGYSHTCALTAINGAKCWGWNVYGQLGDGSVLDRKTAVDVNGLTTGVSAVSAGHAHTCALLATSGVQCWGDNSFGQLGNSDTIQNNLPVAVNGLSSGVSAVSAGGYHTCALLISGGVKCWGANQAGQLGDGSTISRTVPVDVQGLTSGVVAISAGENHTCAVLAAGGVKCWGVNQAGQLGDGSKITRAVPVNVSGLSGVASVVAGNSHTCAQLTNGGAVCWGDNSFGQLGDGSTSKHTTSVSVTSLGGDVTALMLSDTATCASVQGNDGNNLVKCWGDNRVGQLGDESTNDSTQPVVVSNLSTVSAVSANGFHHCVLTGGGGIKCWGSNSRGELGNGSAWSTIPIAVGTVDYFRVQDEQGVPVANAEIWVVSSSVQTQPNGSDYLTLYADQDGYFLPPVLQPGDKLVALQLIRQQSALDIVHEGWQYRIYRTSMAIDVNGAHPYIVGTNSERLLTVKAQNPLVLFHLVVSLGWKSYSVNEPTGITTFLKQLRTALPAASRLLYDATDGQFTFGKVTIYDDGQYWDDADLQILPSNHIRPGAITGGIVQTDPFTYTSSANTSVIFHPGNFRMGRTWNRYGNPMALLDETNGDGYRTLVHEFSHWAFFLYDQYFQIDKATGVLHPASCGSALPVQTVYLEDNAYSLMAQSYQRSEFDYRGSATWNSECEATEHFQVYHESSWETLMRAYADSNPIARYNFNPPSDAGALPGPDLPFPITKLDERVERPQPADLLLQGTRTPWLGVRDSNNMNFPDPVQIYLLKQAGGVTTAILDQGTTTSSGDASLIGVSSGDLIYVNSWNGKYSAALPYNGDDALNIQWSVPGTNGNLSTNDMWKPIVTARPLVDNGGAFHGVHLIVSQVGSINGALMATLFSTGNQVSITTSLLPDGQGNYVGDFVFAEGHTINEAHLWVYEATNDLQATQVNSNTRQVVTSYSIGASPDSHVRSNPPKDPSSSDGYCSFHFADGTLPNSAPALVLPTIHAPSLPGNLVGLSAACYIGVPTGITQFSQTVPLLMYYNDRSVLGITQNTKRIYHWDEAAQHWQPLANGVDDTRNYFVSATVNQPGLYIVAAALLPEVQLATINATQQPVFNVVRSPLTITVPLSDVVNSCQSIIFVRTPAEPGTTGQRYFVGVEAYVNNLTEILPAQSYYVRVNADCTLDLQPGLAADRSGNVAEASSSPALTAETGITLPLSSAPATFYGKVKQNGDNVAAGLSVVAMIDGKPYGRGETLNYQGESVYVIDVPADDLITEIVEGAKPGQTINLQVGGVVAKESVAWHNEQATQVDLTVTDLAPAFQVYLPVVSR